VDRSCNANDLEFVTYVRASNPKEGSGVVLLLAFDMAVLRRPGAVGVANHMPHLTGRGGAANDLALVADTRTLVNAPESSCSWPSMRPSCGVQVPSASRIICHIWRGDSSDPGLVADTRTRNAAECAGVVLLLAFDGAVLQRPVAVGMADGMPHSPFRSLSHLLLVGHDVVAVA
jgi:hypothetical protein